MYFDEVSMENIVEVPQKIMIQFSISGYLFEEKEDIEWKKFMNLYAMGEGNSNPLQYSCLENPVDREAWWAAVHRVTRSQTQLKWPSMHSCIGEGNGSLLQHSCMENANNRGAWWAAIHGVTQNRTGLKWLSSSSSCMLIRALNTIANI